MSYRVAFAGFRHVHLYDMYERMQSGGAFEVVAACEEDAATRQSLELEGKIAITHDSLEAMLTRVDFDVLAVGDYFARRGPLIRQALTAGKEVISDKPICTSIADLDEIESFVESGGPVLGAMLDLRDSGAFIRVRELVGEGAIGEVLSIYFNGNHPLLLGQRPDWYFEAGKQGGTINDLGVHAFDVIPWITGESWNRVDSARAWNPLSPDLGKFQCAAQVMLTLSNGCGVIGDLSYLSPDSFTYSFPHYWRFVFTGSKGVIEAGMNYESILLYKNGETGVRPIAPASPRPGGYLGSFVREIEGRSEPGDLTAAEILRASRVGLLCQSAADGQRGNLSL